MGVQGAGGQTSVHVLPNDSDLDDGLSFDVNAMQEIWPMKKCGVFDCTQSPAKAESYRSHEILHTELPEGARFLVTTRHIVPTDNELFSGVAVFKAHGYYHTE